METAQVLRSSFLGCEAAGNVMVRSGKRSPAQIVMTSEFEKQNPYTKELKQTASFISQPGKGILASDESNATTGKRSVCYRCPRL